jgi:hypothetical protein
MDPVMEQEEAQQPAGSNMVREEPEIPDARKALVGKLCKEIEADKRHWSKDFDRMREDQRFAKDGAKKSWKRSGKYVANITQRHVRGKVASLYAKNPKIVVRRKKRKDFKVWDGSQASLQLAIQATQMVTVLPGMMPPQEFLQAQQVIMDAAQGLQRRKLYESVGETLQILIQSQLSEQVPPFKRRMKTLVRNAVITGVGYVKLGFQRLYETRPETAQRIAELELRLANIERMMADLQDGETQDYDAEAEQLRQAMMALQSEPEVLAREGLVFDFPASTSIIPHRKCHTLAGFLGGDWVTEEFLMSADEIAEIWKIDMKGAAYRPYTMSGRSMKHIAPDAAKPEDHMICVWMMYHRRDGVVYVMADGYNDFLEEPAAPPVRLERFYPWFALVLNELEDDETIFPPSDVRLLMPMQDEYNRARQSLREHRRANRPKYATAKGMLSEDDKELLKNHEENAVLELEALQGNQKVDDVLQPVKTVGIDPNLYEVGGIFEDFQRVGGSQEANLGGTSSSTATESSIAESSRMSDLSSNKDDLDDLLTEMFREAGTVCLTEFSAEQVLEIVGPGAVWPEWTASEIAGELYLEVEAGSSGRPNKQLEVQNYKEFTPLALQMPGLDPHKWLEEGIRRMDDRLEVEDFIDANMPAIVALNRMSQIGTGNPDTDPNQQGARGGDNAQRPQGPSAPSPGPGSQAQRAGGAAGGTGGPTPPGGVF